MNKLLLVLTGPSGVGKTTLCTQFLKTYPNAKRVITSTTRPPRYTERYGEDYWFETDESFKQKLEAHEFLEHAQVYQYHYGVSLKAITGYNDRDLIICLDVQGAQTFRTTYHEKNLGHRLVIVFVTPPTLEELEKRIKHRGTDNERTIRTRLETAKKEQSVASSFDYCLYSGTQDQDFLNLQHIYEAEKMRS